MRNRALYILSCVILCFCSACFEKEYFEPVQKENDAPIRFSATPKGFVQANVGTRAGETEGFDPKTFENTIYNAFFLMFDHNGTLRIKEKAKVVDSSSVTYNLGRDMLNIFDRFTICFLANIPETVLTNDFTVGTTTWTDMQNYYLTMTYAPFSETGTVGVPAKTDLNGDTVPEYALPMFGSKEVTAPYSQTQGYYSFQLERLFARVEVLVSLGIQDDGNLGTSTPQFSLVQCDFNNIPRLVPLLRQSGATACANIPDGETANKLIAESISTYNLTTDASKIMYYSSATDPSYRSFYCYIPEHKLGDCGDNDVPGNKPTLLSGTQRAAYLSFGGFIVDRQGTSYDAKYNIFFGENATDNFDLSRNTTYRNYVRINGVNSADHRVEKMKEVKEVINDVTRKGMAANCYVISTEGTYMLPAYRGAYNNMANATMCEIGTNVVIACDNPAISITFDENLSKQSTIVFKVDNTGLNLLSGNAVIGRYKENGELDWSWHLWFIPGAEFGSGSNDLGETNRIGGLLDASMYDGTVMADRNLGVLASLTSVDSWLPPTMVGLYYRYGHRNPYFEDKKYGNGTAYHGLNNSDYASWNTAEKAVTDPCPPGYRVPPASVWQGANAQNATNEHYSGMLTIQVSAFNYWNHGDAANVFNDIMYPYGHMTPSGVVSSGTADYRYSLKSNITETQENQIRTWNEGSIFNRVYYREIERTETIYSDFQYGVPSVASNIGEVLTQSPSSMLRFETSVNVYNRTSFQNAINFQSCVRKVTKATVIQSRSLLSSWSDYGSPSNISSETTTLRQEPTSVSWREQAVEEILPVSILDLNPQKNIGQSGVVAESPNPAYGYQVRCVKE